MADANGDGLPLCASACPAGCTSQSRQRSTGALGEAPMDRGWYNAPRGSGSGDAGPDARGGSVAAWLCTHRSVQRRGSRENRESGLTRKGPGAGRLAARDGWPPAADKRGTDIERKTSRKVPLISASLLGEGRMPTFMEVLFSSAPRNRSRPAPSTSSPAQRQPSSAPHASTPEASDYRLPAGWDVSFTPEGR